MKKNWKTRNRLKIIWKTGGKQRQGSKGPESETTGKQCKANAKTSETNWETNEKEMTKS